MHEDTYKNKYNYNLILKVLFILLITKTNIIL